MFNNKKIAKLEQEVKTLNDAAERLKSEFEVKGFTTANENNEYLKQLYSAWGNAFKIIDFSEVNRDQLIDYYKSNAQVRGIIDRIADAVAELSDYTEVVNKEGEEKKHWILDVLEQPNDRENKHRFIKAWVINRLVFGDAFVYAEKGLGMKKGKISEMYVMPSNYVDIIVGGFTKPIQGYKLKNFTKITPPEMTPENVMMSFQYNPDPATFYGLSPLYSAIKYVQLLETGLKRQNTAFQNGGVAHIVTPKGDNFGGVTETQADAADREMNKAGNVNKNKFIRVPLEIHPVGNTAADLSILETSKDAVIALCFVLGIPVDIYLGQAKYENTKEAKKAVYEQAAIPLYKEFLEDLTAFAQLRKEGLRLYLNTDQIEILKQSGTEVLTNLEKMNASINEKRDFMGYELIAEKWADAPIIPLGVTLGYETIQDIDESTNV